MNHLGLKSKVVIITVVAMTALTAALQAIGYYRFNQNVYSNYVKYATFAVEEAVLILDKYSIGDAVIRGEMSDDYEKARLELNEVKTSAEIGYLYAVYFEDIEDIKSACYVINAKSEEELSEVKSAEEIYSYLGDPCEEDGFEEINLRVFQSAIKNDTPGIIEQTSDTPEYGQLLTCCKVVHDSTGKPVAILGVDIDINEIRRELQSYIKTSSLFAAIIAVLFITLFVFITDRKITKPVHRLSENTASYVKLMKDAVSPEELVYEKVRIRSDDEIQDLSKSISRMADEIKDYMVNLETVMAEKERIGAELNVATQIQADMLPRIFPPFPDRHEFDIYASMTPAKEVGGDFYDFFFVDHDHLALVCADVSGKGVPAALFMVIAKTLIKNRAQLGGSPSEVLAYANEQLCEGNDAELFVTVWLAIIEISTGRGIAANAGHEHPALMRANGEFELVKYRHSPAVATFPGLTFKEHEFELNPGDKLFVYTDGVTEATDSSNVLFGEERLVASLNSGKDFTPDKLIENVKSDIDRFVGDAPQFDDITMLSISWNKKQ